MMMKNQLGVFPLVVTLVFASVLWPAQQSRAQDAVATTTEQPESAPVAADTDAAPDAEEVVELKMLDDEQNKDLDDAWAVIKANSTDIDNLDSRIKKETGIMREVLETRLDTIFIATLEAAIGFAEQVADLRDDGYDISAHIENVTRLLEQLPPTIREAADRIRDRAVIPDFTQSAAEQAAIDEQFFSAVRAYNQTNNALIETAKVDARFSVDATELEAAVRENIADGAANTSIFLDLAVTQVNNLRAGTVALPDDTELKAKLKVAEDRVKKIAALLESNLSTMTDMGIPTTQYKQQLLTATGAISASSLEIDVVAGLLQDWGNALLETALEQGPDFLFQAFLFVAIIYISRKLAQLVQHGVNTALDANKRHLSLLLRQMLSASSKNIVMIFGVLIALSQVGISLGPLLTGLGIVGFIVGFALQDSLSNFASGMMILFYRPFDVGDTIEAGGARGKVSSMSLVNTTIRTFDNQSLIIPNNKIWQDVITNVTDQKNRRVDMQFGITYDEDIDRVEKLLLELVTADDRVLDDPEPVIKVGSFGDSSVNLLVRPWVKTEDYWDVLWGLNKKVKQAFDREGISIPFPQRDVHVYQQRASQSVTAATSSFDPPDVPEGDAPEANEPAPPEGNKPQA